MKSGSLDTNSPCTRFSSARRAKSEAISSLLLSAVTTTTVWPIAAAAIAAGLLFLASDESRFATDTILHLARRHDRAIAAAPRREDSIIGNSPFSCALHDSSATMPSIRPRQDRRPAAYATLFAPIR